MTDLNAIRANAADSKRRIGEMCANLRPPKMSIPVSPNDDDEFICRTLDDLLAYVDALASEVPVEESAACEIERANRVYGRGAHTLMALMQAYERRVRSDCTSQADIDARPWECAEYRAAADYLRKTWPRAADPERVEIARCSRCGGLPRPTLMGRTICDRCGGLEVPQPPSPTVLRQIEAMNPEQWDAKRKAELTELALKLATELAACKMDVERYRWLRDSDGNDLMEKLMAECSPPRWDELVDAAIDAAMGERP